MKILKDNEILASAEKKIESELLPDVRENYLKIVVAGMKAGVHGGLSSILASLEDSEDPVKDCAVGSVNLVLLLRRQSRGTMPVNALVPAAMTLMIRSLDFAHESGIVEVGREELVSATKTFTNQLFRSFNMNTSMLNSMAGKVTGVLGDPAKLERVNRKAGVVKDPRASTPTDMGE